MRIEPIATTIFPSERTSSTSPVLPVPSRTREPVPTAPVRTGAVPGGLCFFRQAFSLLADALLYQSPRLPGRGLVPRMARGTESLLHSLPRIHEVGAGLLPPRAIRVLLPSFELRLAGGLPFVLDPEPGLERVEIHGPLLEPRLDALQLSPPLLDRGEQGVEVALRGRHPRLRVGEDIGRDAESPRNGEPVRAAGYAFDETVCRRQRSGVELERRIHHATRLARRGS